MFARARLCLERILYESPVAVEARKKRAGIRQRSFRPQGVEGPAKSKKGVGTMKRLAGFLVGMVGLALEVFSGGALAATECNGVITGTVVGGVVVNAGDSCFLGGPFLGPYDGAHISGGVRVNPGGILFACASTINGGIVANGAANLIIGAEEIGCPGSVINGGVRISNTGPGVLSPAPSIALENSVIHGAVHLT